MINWMKRWIRRNIVGDGSTDFIKSEQPVEKPGFQLLPFEVPEIQEPPKPEQTITDFGTDVVMNISSSFVTGVIAQTLEHLIESEEINPDKKS